MVYSRSGSCISVSHLKKKFGNKTALDGVSFEVEYGKVFGFLGPNGAGKSTTIKILTTLLLPSSGNVEIFGMDVTKFSAPIRKRIGVVSQQPSLEANLTVERAMDLYGLMWGIRRTRRKEKITEIMESFDLQEIRNIKNDELSIGQKRRVQVAREFIHEMDLLFLDEPTVGLDPAARRMLLDYIKNQVKSGLTVFFTTHIMEEAEYLCDELAIINRGKIIAYDTPLGLKKKYGKENTILMQLKEKVSESILELITKVSPNSQIIKDGENGVRITSIDSQNTLAKLIENFTIKGLKIINVSISSPSLEDVFLTMVK
ncbi:ABC transporter ATP-binding protein [Candidatus Nitrosocosmicus arcticus]|uniref:ABC-type multidrug transport system, ATPase component n=1 Tax=Candidatus Nitrosocosmicus arcticus TaxID=2035267 RepID=A0A557SWV4_9ARCH|nr:ATP-binding cassette domain-containing protein [Candidatus Nitrosocosmicus arcticus]TVP41088.1 ABC-type multidrug transport system, ATPase component [Candidatus Nitrosocosmicus arcticus]